MPGEPPSSTYREFRPPAGLAPHLVCLWTQAIGPGASHPQRVLPDGCADIVWIGDAATVAGPATGPVTISLPAGAVVLGARFRPGAAPRFLGVPASELCDREVPLRDLWGRAVDRLSDEIARQHTAERQLAQLAAALESRLPDAPAIDGLVQASVRWLARHPDGRIGALGRAAGISARQLQRRFAVAVGYGPKTFQRILRLQRLLALAERPSSGLAPLAAEAGYADQAHMTRELQALTGRSPATLLPGTASTLAMSDLFKTASGPG